MRVGSIQRVAATAETTANATQASRVTIAPKKPSVVLLAKDRRWADVEAALAKTPELINAYDPDGNTLLHHAAEANDPVAVRMILVRNPALMSRANDHGETPLEAAIRDAYLDAVDEMILAVDGATLPAMDGNTAVHWAAWYGSARGLARLLSANPELLNAPNDLGNTLAHLAAVSPVECGEKFRLLAARKADLGALNNDQLTPLLFAIVRQCVVGIDAILAVDPRCENDTTSLGKNALHVAVEHAQLPIVKRFAKQKFAAMCAVGGPPIVYLMVRGSVADMKEVANLLLDVHPQAAEIRTINRESLLHLAARFRRSELFEILADRGVPVDAVDRKKLTALHIASDSDHAPTLKAALRYCPSLIEARDLDGKTALLRAVESGLETSVRLLLNAGANVGVVGAQGQNVLEATIEQGTLSPANSRILGELNRVAPRAVLQRLCFVSRVKAFGHSIALNDTVTLGRQSFTLSGGFTGLIARREYEALAAQLVHDHTLTPIERHLIEQWRTAMESAWSLETMSPIEQRVVVEKLLKERQLVLIPAGWHEHAIWMLATGERTDSLHGEIYNRGEGVRASTDDAARAISVGFDSPTLGAHVARIATAITDTDADRVKAEDRLYAGTSQSSNLVSRAMFLSTNNGLQKAGNCGIANLRAAFLGFLQYKLRDRVAARELFKKVTEFRKAQDYLGMVYGADLTKTHQTEAVRQLSKKFIERKSKNAAILDALERLDRLNPPPDAAPANRAVVAYTIAALHSRS